MPAAQGSDAMTRTVEDKRRCSGTQCKLLFPGKLLRPSLAIWLTVIITVPLVMAWAQAPQSGRAELQAPDTLLELTTIPLWDDNPPGALGNSVADIPTLTIFRPQRGSGNGTSVIVAPGGAYL